VTPPSAVELSVPGNLLLLGEYAVLEEGGLGLAAAVEPRVRLAASASDDFRVEGSWPGGSGGSPVITAAVRVVAEHLRTECKGRLRVDSSALFSADGRKAGLGSSAAVSVAVVCGLLAMAGRPDAARGPEAASLAVRAHRLAHGGRGSGYDVLASFHGGWGVFHGGAVPAWEPHLLPAGTRFMLFHGPAAVSTADAVGRYNRWKEENPQPARDFLRESNDALRSFLTSARVELPVQCWERCRNLGVRLAKSIGVPAEITPPDGLDASWCKALGAGNELGVCLLPPGSELPGERAGLRRVELAETGVRWER
jgi:phosphomevalonate kinase